MKLSNKIHALEAHLINNPLDWGGWIRLFDAYDYLFLERAHEKYPNSAIRAPHADFILNGSIKGLGGCIPPNWDGSVYDWFGKQIK